MDKFFEKKGKRQHFKKSLAFLRAICYTEDGTKFHILFDMRIQIGQFVSLFPYVKNGILCQQSEILMQGVSSVEGTLFYFTKGEYEMLNHSILSYNENMGYSFTSYIPIIIMVLITIALIVGLILHFKRKKSKLKAEMQSYLPFQNKAWKIIRENDTDKAIQVSFEQDEHTVVAVSTKMENLLVYGIKDYDFGDSGDIIIQWLKVIPFHEILNCRFLEDNETVMSGSAGSAFVGGLIGGATGAIIGSSTASSKGMVNSMQIRIDLKDVVKPCCTIPLIPSPIERSSPLYKKIYQKAQEIYATVLAIINLNKEREEQEKAKAERERAEEAAKQRAEEDARMHAETEALPASADKQQASVAEQLRECKALLDEGILTQEEFDAKKKSLLGL